MEELVKKLILTVVVIALLGLIAIPAFAQSGIVQMKATVTKLQGEVILIKAGLTATETLKVDAILGSGDKVETKDNGKVELTLDNGNMINLTPNSEIILSSLTSNPETGDYENLMESKFGTIRAHVVAKVKGKSAFKIKTPTAISGARGTIFYLVITATETRVFVTDGSVDFSNPNSGDTFVIVQDMASLSTATGVAEPVELTGADKEAVIAACAASLSDECELLTPPDQDVPGAPSQNNSPQTPTDNPPPDQNQQPNPPSPS